MTNPGGISGQVFGSPAAEDGDYIETSPIAAGMVDNGYVVVTISGSRYFLSPEEADQKANIAAALKDMAKAKNAGTITLTKKRTDREQVEEALEKLQQQGRPRATFSLGNLGLAFLTGNTSGNNSNDNRPQQQGQESESFLLEIAQNAPAGVPILARWNTNKDGSITGQVYGSEFMGDGDLVTTSPIAHGTKKRFETVTTVSGSMYYLS
jgi:hypothetical protein